MLKPNQLRAARALLGLSQNELAQKAGVSELTVINFEGGKNVPLSSTLQKISTAIEQGGAEFTDYDGVRLKPAGVTTYEGQAGFFEFFEDVYQTIKKFGGDVSIAGVDEKLFAQYSTDKSRKEYSERMAELDNYFVRCIIREGDMNFAFSAYCEYRWLPEIYFKATPFYVYGGNMAIFNFDQDLKIYVVREANIANAFRKQFDLQWSIAKKPPTGGKK